ncbi:MAG TPA: HPF/RaiA family ribosome-associated protein [Chroococcales cyanobacterium]
MNCPLQITFKNVEDSGWIHDLVQSKAADLEKYYDRITSCTVLVEMPHRRHHTGNQYHVRIDLCVPDKEIVVNRDSGNNATTDIRVAIRDAFDNAGRQLEELVCEKQQQLKSAVERY